MKKNKGFKVSRFQGFKVSRFQGKNYNLLEININMKRIKFAGDARKKTFRNSNAIRNV